MRKITVLLCLTFLAFNSCEKENIFQEDTIQEKNNRKGILETVWEQGQGKVAGGIIDIVIESGHGREPGAYLTYTCDEPIHFQIDSQHPCDVLNVDSETGRLSLLDGGVDADGLCGNDNNAGLSVEYSVTDIGGEIESHSFILSYEDFIIIHIEEE